MESSKALPKPPRGALPLPLGSGWSPGAAARTRGRQERAAQASVLSPSSVPGPRWGSDSGAPVCGSKAGTLLPCSQRCRGAGRPLVGERGEVPWQHPPAPPAAPQHVCRSPSANVAQPSSREVQH